MGSRSLSTYYYYYYSTTTIMNILYLTSFKTIYDLLLSVGVRTSLDREVGGTTELKKDDQLYLLKLKRRYSPHLTIQSFVDDDWKAPTSKINKVSL